MLADVRVLHVPTSDTNVLPPIILQVGTDRYLFNVGEGTSRSSTQRKANLSRISKIFVSRVGWEAIGGLPGVLMSMADGKRTEAALYGPSGIRYALATMRTYAKRDTMKLDVKELDVNPTSQASASQQPIYHDENMAVYAVTLLPASQSGVRTTKRPKLETESNGVADFTILKKMEKSWKKADFNPTTLHGKESEAWVQLVSDSIFNDSLLQKQSLQNSVSLPNDVEMDVEVQEPPRSPTSIRNGKEWRPPLSPAFVTKLLPPPPTDRRFHSENRADPAEGGQAPVLAYICEAHPQRGKFDPKKASAAGVIPGPSYSALTNGEDVKLKRPRSWSNMPHDEKNKWIQSRRPAGSKKAKSKPNANGGVEANQTTTSPASWDDLEEVVIKSQDVMGPSRAGAVVFQIYLPSIEYIDDLVSSDAAATFGPYTESKNEGKQREQSRTPHVIVHTVPIEVLRDARYQQWMLQFGSECYHILANRDVCANKLMYPSSATIPLRLSKLDPHIFQVPQYQVQAGVDPQNIFEGTSSKIKLLSAEADQVVQLHPRGEPKKFPSGAPDFDFPLDSVEAEKLASFELEPLVEETEEQARQLAKAKAKNQKGNGKSSVNESADVEQPKNVKLQEARKKAWSEFLDVIKQIKKDAPIADANHSNGVVHTGDDVLITTLGTGSAAPSKYRNVISTLIQTPSSGNILLDAGESTYGLLRRKFGCRRDGDISQPAASSKGQDVDQILAELRILFISHIHADHHIGLIRLLLERRKLVQRPKHPLYLIGTSFVHNYLREYERIEKLGLDEDVILLMNEQLGWATGVDPLPHAPKTEKASGSHIDKLRAEHLHHIQSIKSSTGLSYVHTARVEHRGYHCYGLVVRHSDGWSVTYSGDTRPAPELIAAGKDTTLLIHEATLEDSQQEMAVYKGHSTFGEAIKVGKDMGAKNILLTHFSQRYPKMAKSSLFAASVNGEGGSGVPIALAYDMVTYPLSQFRKVQSYTPAMEALFAADIEGDDEVDSTVDADKTNGQAGAGKDSSEQDAGHSKDSADASQHLMNGTGCNTKAAKGQQSHVVSPMQVEELKEDNGSSPTTSLTAAVANQPKSIRKAFKPTLWRYIGIVISTSSPSSSTMPTIHSTYVAELIRTAQSSTLGLVGGAFPFDVLSVHSTGSSLSSEAKTALAVSGVHCVVRTLPSHAQDLTTCLAALPAPRIGEHRLRLRTLGPTSSIQTLLSLF